MNDTNPNTTGQNANEPEITGKIIYLYGLPASGKTVLCEEAKKIRPNWHMVNANQYLQIFNQTAIPNILANSLPHEFNHFKNCIKPEKRRFVLQQANVSLDSLVDCLQEEQLAVWDNLKYTKLTNTISKIRNFLEEKNLHTNALCRKQAYTEIFKNAPKIGNKKIMIIEFNAAAEMTARLINDIHIFEPYTTHIGPVPFKVLLVYASITTILERIQNQHDSLIGSLNFRLLNNFFRNFVPLTDENKATHKKIDVLHRDDLLALINSISREQFDEYQQNAGELIFTYDNMKEYFLKFTELDQNTQCDITNQFRADAILNTTGTVDKASNDFINIIDSF